MNNELYLIFERAVYQENDAYSCYIRLSCEKQNEISLCTPKRLEIKNNLGMSTPVVTMVFEDQNGDMFNYMKFDTNAVFTLQFGRDVENLFELELKIARIDFRNGVLGSPTGLEFHIDMVAKNWYESTAKRHFRGWYTNDMISVVRDLVEDSKYDAIDVTPAEKKSSPQPIAQTGMSNLEMLEWIRKRTQPSKNITGSGHYEYGMSFSGVFMFKSMNDVISTNEPLIRANRAPVVTIGEDAIIMNEDYQETIKSNQGIPEFFTQFIGREKYMNSVIHGGGDIRASYYDWDQGKYKVEHVVYSKTDTMQLSDTSLINQNHESTNYVVFGGRDNYTINETKSKLQEINNSVQEIIIATQGSGFVDIFQIIELIIFNNDEQTTQQINEMYSGFYMISGVNHIFDFSKTLNFVSELTLTRSGIDQSGFSDTSNLTTSKRGKL